MLSKQNKRGKEILPRVSVMVLLVPKKRNNNKKNRNKVILRNEKSFLSEKLNNDIEVSEKQCDQSYFLVPFQYC